MTYGKMKLLQDDIPMRLTRIISTLYEIAMTSAKMYSEQGRTITDHSRSDHTYENYLKYITVKPVYTN